MNVNTFRESLMRKLFTIGVVLAVAVFLAAGCAKKADLVAKVGDREITVDDFQSEFTGQKQTYPSYETELEQRKEFLNGLVDQKLFLLGAYEKGLDTNREIRTLIEQQQGKFLLDQLYKMEIVDKVSVTDEQVREWYDHSGEEIHARHILVDTKQEADSIRALLDGGADFAELAREKSKDPSAAQNAGDLSWFRWGTMVAPFQEAAFKLKENEISQPVETDYGWHIIQLMGRRPVDRQPFEQAEPSIRQRLTQQLTQERLKEFLTALKDKTELKLNMTQLELIRKTYRDTTGGPLPYVSNLDPTKLNDKQRALPIAMYLDSSLSTGEFLKMANSVTPVKRPNFDDTTAVKDLIFQMVFVPALEREARVRHVDETDEYKEKIAKFRDKLMAEKMRTDLMQRPVDVTPEEAQAYYDEHPEEFSTPPQVRVREALVDSKEAADQIMERVRRGAQFEEICADATVRPGMKAKKGDLGMFRRFQYPNLFDAAQKMNVGQVGGPIFHSTKTGGQYSIIELMGKQDAETKKFDEVKDRIMTKLRNEKRQKAVDDWLAAQRDKTTIEINDDVLAGTIDSSKYPEKG